MRELSRWPCCYIKRLTKMENWERHCDPQIYRKDLIRRCSQTFTTLFRPIKGFICNCNTDPSSIFKTSSCMGQKNPTSKWLKDRDWVFEIYFKLLPDTIGYIRWNHSRKSSSSRCTFFRWNIPPPQTTPEQQNETTIPNAESTMQSAASNDVNNWEKIIEMLTMSNKRTFNKDSSEEDTNNPLPAKEAATSSPASEQSGTRVPKGRGGGDLPNISAFPANAPQPRGRGSSQGDKSPARTARFSNNTGEGSASSAQGGRNRGPINRNPPLKPPGTIKIATKDKTKSKEKIHLHKSWLTTT